MAQKRIQTFDLLKGIAVILMIQVHIVELFAVQSFFDSSLGKLLIFLGGPPVAPVFLMAFGFFIGKSNKSTLQLILRGFWILIIGLLLNIALNFNLIISVYQGKFNVNIWTYIFGVDILFNAGFVIIIMAFIKKYLKQNILLLSVIVLISAFLGNFLLNYKFEEGTMQYFMSVLYGTSSWSYFPVFPWLSYSLSGYLFYTLYHKINFNFINTLKVKIISGVLFILILVFTLKYAINLSSDLQNYYHHGIVFFLWVVVFACFYSFYINETEKIFGNTLTFRYIKWLGKNVTLVYIIHWVIIGNIATEIFKTVASKYHLLFWFISILALSSIVAFLLLQLRKKLRF